MKGFLTRTLCSSLIFAGLAPFAFAQTTTETNVRGAYFVPAPQEPAHAVRPVLSEQADKPLSPAVLSPVVIDPVASSSLPKVSSESFGMADGEGLGADMWEGTDRSVAEWLLSQALPSRS
ncbi:MAG: hypothetical protein PHE27_08850, partial [Alphaproteobacteria bacterium]|nr:hypothetical protein [Alphaproteobacteria bacterium]